MMNDGADNEDDTLVLSFGTSQPIDAADIGILLREMSSDYRRATGGRLVLWRYETGSSWIYLRDAIAVAGSMAGSISSVFVAVQHMATFVKLLKSRFEQAGNLTNDNNTEMVAKSAARMVKIAAESGADIALRYSKNEKAGLETISVTVNHQRAAKLHLSSKQKKGPATKVVQAFSSIDVEQMARRLTATDTVSDEVVDAIVSALAASGGGHLLPQLVSSLEAAGRYDVARTVRKHISPPGHATMKLTRD